MKNMKCNNHTPKGGKKIEEERKGKNIKIKEKAVSHQDLSVQSATCNKIDFKDSIRLIGDINRDIVLADVGVEDDAFGGAVDGVECFCRDLVGSECTGAV